MKSKQLWNIRVDGTRHEVYVQDKGNSFDVFVDDEFRFNVRSDINLDIEEDLTVGSKRCRIAIYRGVPDLIVDGILLNADAELVRKERNEKRLTILGAVFLMLLGTFALGVWVVLQLAGTWHIGGALVPVFALLFCAAGVMLLVRALRKREY